MTNSVKFLHSGMAGAPVMNGTAGTMIGVLDACLINGFGGGALDSLVIANNVATATRSAGHSFEVGSVVEIAGATVSGGTINGQHRVTSVTSTTYTFATTGLANQTATGSITHKLAALGFEKSFSGTNLAVYRSPNVAGTRMFLRVDDTGTTSARVVGYESMTDVNTGSGPFPTNTQVSGGLHWGKSSSADSTSRPWTLCGDDRGFVLVTAGHSAATNGSCYFGDIAPVKTPDPYACLIAGQAQSPANWSNLTQDVFSINSSYQTYTARSATGVGASTGSLRMAAMLINNSSNFASSSGGVSSTQWPQYPNLGDNGLYVSRILLGDLTPQIYFRGVVPGVYFVPMRVTAGTFQNREVVSDIVGLAGKTLRALTLTDGVGFVDATGPWR